MAVRITRNVMQESAIFEEFNQSKSLIAVVILFPLAPVALLGLTSKLGWGPAVIVASACYLPAMVISRRQLKVFDRSGTDRTNRAKSAATQAFGTALVGLIYVALYLVLIYMNIGANNLGGIDT